MELQTTIIIIFIITVICSILLDLKLEAEFKLINAKREQDRILLKYILKEINSNHPIFEREKYVDSISDEQLNELMRTIQTHKIKNFSKLEHPLIHFRLILIDLLDTEFIFEQFKKNNYLIVEKMKKDIIRNFKETISNENFVRDLYEKKLK
jgi:hypothetical protein